MICIGGVTLGHWLVGTLTYVYTHLSICLSHTHIGLITLGTHTHIYIRHTHIYITHIYIRHTHIYIYMSIYLSITHTYRSYYIRTLTFEESPGIVHVYPVTDRAHLTFVFFLSFLFLGMVHVYSVTDRAHLTLVHKTPVEGVPRAICPFQVDSSSFLFYCYYTY